MGGITKQTYTVRETAVIFGVGKSAMYEAIKRGEIQVIRIGGRFVISVGVVERMLNGETPSEAAG